MMSKINSSLIWVVLVGIIAIGYMRIDNLKLKLEASNIEQERLNSLVIHGNSQLDSINKDLTEQKTITSRLNDRYKSNADELNKLNALFNKRSDGKNKDIDIMGKEQPKVLEGKINEATKIVGERIESATTRRPISTK